MKLFCNYVLAFLAFGLIGEAYAVEQETWYYAEPLPTMSPDLPDSYECLDAQCRLENVDEYEPVRTTNGYEVRIQRVDMYRGFICRDGYCYDLRTNREIGISTHERDYTGGYPLGYYFVSNNRRHLEYHRRGTGPYADRFPAFYVYGEEEQVETNTQESADAWESPQGIANNIDIWCDPMTDECRLDGRITLHHELPDFLPMANIQQEQSNDHWCDGPVCYDNAENFIGLNPFFY